MDRLDLAYAGITRQVELLRAREVSARELLEVYLDRIERLGEQLNCFRSVMAEQALEEADAAQAHLDAGDPAQLLGVPIAIKDTVDVAGELTTHGTAAVTRPARADSEVVRRLRRTGAVIIGKTTVPELLCGATSPSRRTWGITRNPWNLDRSCGGSSGGSAVAVALPSLQKSFELTSLARDDPARDEDISEHVSRAAARQRRSWWRAEAHVIQQDDAGHDQACHRSTNRVHRCE